MIRLIFSIILWATAANATSFPEHTSTTVNDFAELLEPQQEETLSAQLSSLKAETGVEMTVVTLVSQRNFAPDLTLEAFATALFDHWGVGNSSRNDGIMVLVFRDDRAMRLELGRAYGNKWDRAAADVVDNSFVKAFAREDYARGILNGSTAVIGEIIRPFLAKAPPPKEKTDFTGWLVFAAFALIGLAKFKQNISDGAMKFRKCPSCGQRTLQATRTIDVPASTIAAGNGTRHIQCRTCNHATQESYDISIISTKSSGGFGGGSSGGGGASGRW